MRTEYLAHEDGRWIEFSLDDFQQRALGPEEAGGLLVGADPQCDIVIDDDGIEDFHVRLFGRGHHPNYIECIAGSARRGDYELAPGEEMRGSGTFAGWSESYFNESTAPDALRTALSVARDAELEGRLDEANAIRLEAGYRKFHVPWRKQLPERLAQSEQLARVRVIEAETSVIWALGALARLEAGITIGGDATCDIVVRGAGENRVRVRATKKAVDLESLAGAGVRGIGRFAFPEPRPAVTLDRRWQRFEVGDAIVQLCRWPRRDEPIRTASSR